VKAALQKQKLPLLQLLQQGHAVFLGVRHLTVNVEGCWQQLQLQSRLQDDQSTFVSFALVLVVFTGTVYLQAVTCDGLLCTAVGGCSVAVFLHWLYDWLISAALCLAK
jgi:hypothetical protein